MSGGGKPESAILFVGVSLLLGMISRQMFSSTRVPYTVALLLLGIALGALEYGTHTGLGIFGDSIRAWANINPNLILFVFLPALLFESSFNMELHQIKRCLGQMVLLAGPGVVISTICLGAVIRLLFPYGWNWKVSLLLGGALSATDPVAVVALLKELGASKKVNTILEGESLMNDGTAIVVYRLFYRMVLGEGSTALDAIKFLSQITLGAVALGLAFGLVSFLWLGVIFNDTVLEITLTLTVSYIAYLTAEDAAEVSGVLTVMTLGMFYAAIKTAFKGESQRSLHHFWEMVTYIANTLIFILSGVVIAENILREKNSLTGQSWGYLILLYVFVQLSRVVVLGVLYPGLKYLGYGLDWKEALILLWSGLRGAVALALSLILNRSSYSADIPQITHKTGALFVFLTGGVVFLTLIINGSTTQFLLHFLGLDKTSETKMKVLEFTRYEMHNKALQVFQELGDDEELGPADWSSVMKYTNCLKEPSDGTQPHPHQVLMDEEGSVRMNKQDTRLRLLHGVQAAYWGMLDEGRITQTAAFLLMQSVDEAIDLVESHELLLDWKGLEAHVQFPTYFKYLKLKALPKKLVTFFTVERLELACYVCAAFLRAHRIARRHLREFIGESEVAEAVIRESEGEGEPAKQFLEDVRLTFPQVLRVVKTKQVTYSVLLHLSEYVQNLQKIGLLEEKEVNHLHDSVQTDLKKLLRKPPLVRMPSVPEIVNSHPWIGALQPDIRQALGNSAKQLMVMRRDSLYKEGSEPEGIWLIANGVVQWENKRSKKRHFLHPTFSHGGTLGLYECLTGRPYLCGMTADTVVHCFFIEKENILSALRSTPAIEDFFWQESAMIVAKLMAPEQLEELSMQEMRSLVLEHSIMRCYVRGKNIEVALGKIAILLEGFIKQEDSSDLIRSPAALHPPDNAGTWLMEAAGWCRVVSLDMISFFNSVKMTRNSESSMSPLPMPMPQQKKPQQQRQKKQQRQHKTLSERSLRLSLFGSAEDVVANNAFALRRLPRPPPQQQQQQQQQWSWAKSFRSSNAILLSSSAAGAARRPASFCMTMNKKPRSHGSLATTSGNNSQRWMMMMMQGRSVKKNKIADTASSSDNDEDEEVEELDLEQLQRIDSPSHLFEGK